MGKSNTIQNDSPAKALDFGRALDNLIIPIPELIGSCVEAKAALVALLDMINDSDDLEVLETVKFVSFTLSMCADFFGDALSEGNAKHTASRKAAYLTKFREVLNNMMNNG